MYATCSTGRSSIPRSTILCASSSEKNHARRQSRSKSDSHSPSDHELKCRHAHFGIGVPATNNEKHASPSTTFNMSNCKTNSLGTLATNILSLEKKFLLDSGRWLPMKVKIITRRYKIVIVIVKSQVNRPITIKMSYYALKFSIVIGRFA